MEDYRELGTRYLHTNKKRSFITVLGCFIVAAGLFAFLNSMVCWVEKCRIDARKDDDCEIVILTQDKDTIEKIVNEDFVTSAYLGKAYSWTVDSDDEVYANALHINVREKYLIAHYANYITKTYCVDTELNDLLAWTYCQDGDGIGYLMILFGLLIAFVLAIIGVGVLRNNISISAMERVKDYGNLRCIGATKKQLKAIVYRESMFLETVGIVAGIAAGFLISIPICNSPKRQYPIGFHILPVILLLIAFYGDMYFAVGDGLKKVLQVSPVEAVRGTYRIKNKSIKRRSSGIWRLLFGVEGDYAYKNIKRNNGRFIKTVMAMVFGMAVVMVVGGVTGVIYKFYKDLDEMYGYYQQFIENDTNSISSNDEMRMDLYSPGALKKISGSKGISDTKFMYQSTLYTAEDRWVYKRMNKKYLEDTYEGTLYGMEGPLLDLDDPKTPEEKEAKEKKDARKAYRDLGNGLVDYEALQPKDEKRDTYDTETINNLLDSEINICGYDEEDYSRYKDCLIDGTTDLSENGVLLINAAKVAPKEAIETSTLLLGQETYQFLDVKVGDEIKVVDPVEMYNLVQEERDRAKDKIEKYDVRHNRRKEAWILDSAREKLIEEGKFKTLVVEGIVETDPNRRSLCPTLAVPLENYYEITGKTESDYNGIMFHISNIFCRDFENEDFINAINERQNYYFEGISETNRMYYSYTSVFLESITSMVSGFKIMLCIVAIIFVLIIISLLNTMNVTISSLQMRRNEFAQLRALGMTKKSLLKAVLLEGGIVWIVSTVLGVIVGILLEYAVYLTIMRLIINSPMYIFWPGIIIAAILSLIVLTGSNYIFFKQMKLDVAGELIRSGE